MTLKLQTDLNPALLILSYSGIMLKNWANVGWMTTNETCYNHAKMIWSFAFSFQCQFEYHWT